jgi:hypothetical protein
VSSFKPDNGSYEIDSTEECICQLVVACGDSSEVFDCVKETFHKIALSIEGVVSVSRFFPV